MPASDPAQTPLTVHVVSAPDCGGLTDLGTAIQTALGGPNICDLKTISVANLNALADTPAIVLCDTAEDAAVCAMHAGNPPSVGITSWVQRAEALARCAETNSSIKLLVGAAILSATNKLSDALQAEFSSAKPVVAPAQTIPSAWFRLLALRALNEHPQARALSRQLAKSALIQASYPDATADACFEAQLPLAAGIAQNDALRERLAEVQLNQKIATAAISEFTQTNADLRMNYSALEARSDSLRDELSQARKTLRGIYRSLSWRLTAPLRKRGKR